MMMPSVYRNRNGLFEDFFDGFFREMPRGLQSVQDKRTFGLMKTDIIENEDGFELDVEMPGCRKEDVKAQVKDGYLIISANTNSESEEKDENGKCIRKERYSGAMSRSFYVGENLTEEDIRAKFEDGVLKLTVPKEEQKKVEEPRYVTIEG